MFPVLTMTYFLGGDVEKDSGNAQKAAAIGSSLQWSRYGKLLLWEGVFVKVPLDTGAGANVSTESVG